MLKRCQGVGRGPRREGKGNSNAVAHHFGGVLYRCSQDTILSSSPGLTSTKSILQPCSAKHPYCTAAAGGQMFGSAQAQAAAGAAQQPRRSGRSTNTSKHAVLMQLEGKMDQTKQSEMGTSLLTRALVYSSHTVNWSSTSGCRCRHISVYLPHEPHKHVRTAVCRTAHRCVPL